MKQKNEQCVCGADFGFEVWAWSGLKLHAIGKSLAETEAQRARGRERDRDGEASSNNTVTVSHPSYSMAFAVCAQIIIPCKSIYSALCL